MLTARLGGWYRWGVVSLCCTAGVVMWGCAPQEPLHPQPLPVDVSKRLAALEACIARSQGAVKAASEAGLSAGPLAPVNSGIADAQDAVDESARLAQQGKELEAVERLTKALEECDKLDAMVAKARQDATERKVRAQMASATEARMLDTLACVESARQSIQSASAAGVRGGELTAAKSALDSAETALKQAWELLTQHDPQSAIGRLETAQAHCQTAREVSDKATARKSEASPARPRRGR